MLLSSLERTEICNNINCLDKQVKLKIHELSDLKLFFEVYGQFLSGLDQLLVSTLIFIGSSQTNKPVAARTNQTLSYILMKKRNILKVS